MVLSQSSNTRMVAADTVCTVTFINAYYSRNPATWRYAAGLPARHRLRPGETKRGICEKLKKRTCILEIAFNKLFDIVQVKLL